MLQGSNKGNKQMHMVYFKKNAATEVGIEGLRSAKWNKSCRNQIEQNFKFKAAEEKRGSEAKGQEIGTGEFIIQLITFLICLFVQTLNT